jgi:hypothetical protein
MWFAGQCGINVRAIASLHGEIISDWGARARENGHVRCLWPGDQKKS